MGFLRVAGGEPCSLDGEPAKLGILRGGLGIDVHESAIRSEIDRRLKALENYGPGIFLFKLNVRSIIHRHDYLDLVVLRESEPGSPNVVASTVFVGLLTTQVHKHRVLDIPRIRRRIGAVLQHLRYPEGSHNHKAALTILDSFPKEEFYYFDGESLAREVVEILMTTEEGSCAVMMRYTAETNVYSPIVLMPKDNFSAGIQRRVQEILREALQAVKLREEICWSEGDLVRLHYYIDPPGKVLQEDELEKVKDLLLKQLETWDNHLYDCLQLHFDAKQSSMLLLKYQHSLPEYYKSSTGAEEAVRDIMHLEDMSEHRRTLIYVTESAEEDPDFTEVKVYSAEPRELSILVPMMENMGLTVYREFPAEVTPPGHKTTYIYTFHVQDSNNRLITGENRRHALSEGIKLVLRGLIEDDHLNRLIVTANLNWWETSLFKTYRNYLVQLGLGPHRFEIGEALINNAEVVRALLDYFHAKFSLEVPLPAEGRDLAGPEWAVKKSLENVASIQEDRILRWIFSIMAATVRTSYYAPRQDDFFIAVKIECSKVDVMPDPRPMWEIYVHSAHMEGIHLRGGMVARGGIRWSDRDKDFRTEILSLMKTQMVKNTVIVPLGSKGGFITKRDLQDPEARAIEGREQYRKYIQALLSLTDNLVEGRRVPPDNCVIYDDHDSYLVVAADRGTAWFSDLANEISTSRGFWLGDAFASGGSRGYNHKVFGITARGAWESVRLHFLERGVDADKDPVTVVGIGDMSGDVFGNGLLCSRAMRLIGAFDHRHIFLDPDPPAEAFEERQRLYDLTKSSWMDYNRDLISRGGGIYDRKAKSIPLSQEVRQLLQTDRHQLNGEQLIQFLLRSPVDLLWNGGIGTYIKSRAETNEQIGDKGNDSVRVDAADVRAKVIGEGGNLGISQRGRIEFDARGGRINTDAIDNSGGVDMSDHEVNLKILFTQLMESGLVRDLDHRDELMRNVASTVAKDVLSNTQMQNIAISLDRLRSSRDADSFVYLRQTLTEKMGLNRILERISPDAELRSASTTGVGIKRPELSVILAYAKLLAKKELLASDLPDHPYLLRYLDSYFPRPIAEEYRESLVNHPLRREIVTTVIVNKIINQAGACFFDELSRNTGKDYATITRAYLFANNLLRYDGLRNRMLELRDSVSMDSMYQVMDNMEGSLYRLVKNILINPPWRELPLERLPKYARVVDGLKANILQTLSRDRKEALTVEVQRYFTNGFPRELAEEILIREHLRAAPYLLIISRRTRATLEDTIRTHFLVGDQLGFDQLYLALEGIEVTNDWEKKFQDNLYHRLSSYQGHFTKTILRSRLPSEDPNGAFSRYLDSVTDAYRDLVGELDKLRQTRPLKNAIPINGIREIYGRIA